MAELPDPVLVTRCAGVVRDRAEALRARAARLGATAEASQWAGPAAHAFRVETHQLVLRLVAAARRLDDAADLLDQHATALRVEAAAAAHRQAEQARLLRAGLHAIGAGR